MVVADGNRRGTGVGGFKNMLEVQMRAQTEPFEWMKGWMLMKWVGRGGLERFLKTLKMNGSCVQSQNIFPVSLWPVPS